MTFTTRNLTGSRVLVSGTDIDGNTGKVVLDGSQWAELNARDDMSKAEADFASTVEAFFKPLTDAAEQLESAVAGTAADGIGYVVIDEGTEGQVARPKRVVSLTHDSIVLRLIEQGNTDRLLWIGDNLEVTEASVAPAPVVSGEDPWSSVEG